MTKQSNIHIAISAAAIVAALVGVQPAQAHHYATPEEACDHLSHDPSLPLEQQPARYRDCISVARLHLWYEEHGIHGEELLNQGSEITQPTSTPTPTATPTPQPTQGTSVNQTTPTPTPAQTVQSTPTPDASPTVTPTAQPETTGAPKQSFTSIVKKVFQPTQIEETPGVTGEQNSESQSNADENTPQESEQRPDSGMSLPYLAGIGTAGLVASLALYSRKRHK